MLKNINNSYLLNSRAQTLLRVFLLLGLSCSFNVFAGDTQVEVNAELGVKKQANLSADQQLAEAEKISRIGISLSERLTKLLDGARLEKDITKVTCLNDKLLQVNANLRTVEQRLKAIREAKQMSDQGRLNHEFTVLSILSQKFGLLDQEANQCVGQDLFEPGAAQVIATTPGTSTASCKNVTCDPGQTCKVENNKAQCVIAAVAPAAPAAAVVAAPPPAAPSKISIANKGSKETKENSGTPLSFTITLDPKAPKDFDLAYSISGTGITAADLEGGLSGKLSINKDATTATLDIKIKGDTTVEADEVLIVALTAPAADTGTLDTNKKTASGKILNDDNSNPVAANDTATVNEDASVEIDVLKNDTDADKDTLSISGTPTATNGSVSITDKKITYKPKSNFAGTDTINYSISDSKGGTATATVSVTVNQVNDPATFSGDVSGSGDEDAGAITGTLTAKDDADGMKTPDYKVSAVAKNGSASIDATSGKWSYTPKANFNGKDSFTIEATDDAKNKETQVINITVNQINDPATFTDINFSFKEGEIIKGKISVTDDVDGMTNPKFTFAPPVKPDVAITSTGEWTYSPKSSGKFNFTVQVTDDDGNIETQTINIEVIANNPPKAKGELSYSVNEDETLQIDAKELLDNFTDEEGDAIKFKSYSQPINGELASQNNNESFTYTPKPNFNGKDSFTYIVTDGKSGNATSAVNITVNAVNDAPTYDNKIKPLFGNVNTPITGALWQEDSFSDLDGDKLSYTVNKNTLPKGLTEQVIAEVTQEAGLFNIELIVSDGKDEITAKVPLTICKVNEEYVDVDKCKCRSGFKDVDGQCLEEVETSVISISKSLIELDEGDEGDATNFEFTLKVAPPISKGTAQIEYKISTSGKSEFTRESSGTISLTGEGATFTVGVKGDADVEEDEKFEVTFSNMFVEFDTGYTGVGAVFKGNANTLIATGTILDNDQAANTPPVAEDDTQTLSADSKSTVINVLDNDTDVDKDKLTVTKIDKTGVKGFVGLYDGVISYDPNNKFNELEKGKKETTTFDYTVSDGKGGEATATVTITIEGINEAPKSCPDNCSGNGLCLNGQCQCESGFVGDNCASKSCPNDCSNNGQCKDGTCQCNAGYEGDSCAIGSSPSSGSVSSAPAQVDSEGTTTVTASSWVSATNSTLSYNWSATCEGGLGKGSFNDNKAEVDWKAPKNETGKAQKCTLTAEIEDTGNNAKATLSTDVEVNFVKTTSTTSTPTIATSTTTSSKAVKKVMSIKPNKTEYKRGEDTEMVFTVTLSCPDGYPEECSANECAKDKASCPTMTVCGTGTQQISEGVCECQVGFDSYKVVDGVAECSSGSKF